MGGNIKNAFTSEPTTKSECQNCNSTFTKKYDSLRKICDSCREDLNTVANLDIDIDLSVNIDEQYLKTKISIATGIPDGGYIDIPVEKISRRKIIFGELKIISEDKSNWFEDIWIWEDKVHPVRTRVKPNRGMSWVSKWPPQNSVGIDALRKEQSISWNDDRKEWLKWNNDPFKSDTLYATFEFASDELDSISETIEMPSFKIQL